MCNFYKIRNNGIQLFVKAVPNSSKNEITGLLENALKIKIKAPAVDNRANEELVKFLSKTFKIAKSKITIESGNTSKLKIVYLSDISIDNFKNFCDKMNLISK